MGEQPNPYRDMPQNVRLVCARGDVMNAIRTVCDAWGLSGPEALLTTEAVLGSMRGAALESTSAQMAQTLAPTIQETTDKPEGQAPPA